jgi:hypothetical protein
MREQMLKAASLLRDAAEQLKKYETPEKLASETVAQMITKGLLPSGERERYTQHLIQNPEKIAHIKESIASLPSRIGAIGEVSSSPVKGGRDAMDDFLYS